MLTRTGIALPKKMSHQMTEHLVKNEIDSLGEIRGHKS
jgi:hypothetical protein